METVTILILLFIVATAVAIAVQRLAVPYTVALVFTGLVLGLLHAFQAPHLTKAQLRKSPANTTLYTSTWNLAAGQYRIQLKLLPNGGEAGYSVKVYSGAGINSDTPVNNSGDLDATSSGITSISRMQIGLIVNPAALTVLRVDDIIADDSTAVSRAAAATTGRFYRQDGIWVPYDNLYRSAGAWVQ